MDFSSLPDHIFVQIFHCLPLRDQIRIGGVSAAFRRVSDIAISETKSLDLKEVNNISPFAFSRLLNLCQGGLKKCNLVESPPGDWQYHLRMADAFNQYSYPQLNTISFDDYYDSIIDISLRKYASNLRSLSVKQINFPDVIMERLETLAIECDDHTVQTLAEKVPNLRHLILTENELSTRALDSFLGTVPRLEAFRIQREFDAGTDDTCPLDLEGNSMTAFWQLNSLSRFEVSYSYFGQVKVTQSDHALIRIAQSFPRLRVLSLCNVESGNEEVAALSTLQDLRVLELKEVQENINVGIRELSKCECLEKLVITYLWVDDLDCVSADTARILLRSCPRLSFIACGELAGINTAGDAVAFVTSLAVFENRVIRLRIDSPQNIQIWESSEVKDGVKNLDEEAGVVVQVLFG